MNDLMQTEDPIQAETPIDKGRLSRGESAVSHRGKRRGQALGWEIGKVINKSNRSKLGNELCTLNLGNERDNNIEPGDVHHPQTKSLNNRTDKSLELGPEILKKGIEKPFRLDAELALALLIAE